MNEIVAKILPIILVIALGYLIRVKNYLSENTIKDLMKIILDCALPAVLFLTFLRMDLEIEYLNLTIAIIILNCLLFFVGYLINKLGLVKESILPFITTCFSFGLLGIPLYGTIFGIENLNKIVILGVGHELFVWIIYINLMKVMLKKDKFTLDTFKNLLKSPLIVAVVTGLIINILGLSSIFESNFILKGIIGSIEYMSIIANPIIFVIVGYGLKFEKEHIKKSVIYVIIRYIIVFSVGYLFKFFVLDKIIINDVLFDYAYFTFLILPGPLSLPIMMSKYSNEKDYEKLANSVVVLNTCVCIVIYIIFVLVK
ncbi:AEC family transporter [Clostridium sp. DL1XJH146]